MTTLVTAIAPAPAATAALPGTTSGRLRVPWSTVLPLAVVAAWGSGFWLIALRGAIGAIERSRGPFAVWLLESTLLLPLHVFAVLAAMALALRWFGPGPLRPRNLVVTLVLMATTSTLASLVVQAANAVHDYRLQVQHVANMALHLPTCDTTCVANRLQSAWSLQVHALALNGVVMLVSNLVLLGLVVALRGGRLDVARPARRAGAPARFGSLEITLMVALAGTATIHATLVPDQLARWPLGGIALLLLAVLEVDVALLFLLRLRFVHLLAGIAVSAAPLLAWLYSRAAGMPFGPGAGNARPIGLTDTAAALLEVVTLALAIVALRSRGRRTDGLAAHPVAAAVAGVLAVVVAAVAVGLGLIGNEQATRLQQGDHVHASAGAIVAPRLP